ncbi:MAG: 6-phosphofructokinase [Actinomycetota bacterium]|nr:6-phosphofructokinase [Actinomycetota bacterium]
MGDIIPRIATSEAEEELTTTIARDAARAGRARGGFSVGRIGVLTGGGDCPGLNAALRAVVRKGIDAHDHTILGFRDGWRGVLNDEVEELTRDSVRGILHRGGTILGSSPSNPFRVENGVEMVRGTFRDEKLDALIAIGGEGTLTSAAWMAEEGLPVLGVPKTIDNDIAATDYTFGFDTALQVASDAIDRLHSTAESHNRVMVVEVMGRHAGWIGLYAGLAGGADALLIPEHPFDLEEVCRHLRHRHLNGNSFSIVVVSEGAIPVEGTLEVPEYPLDELGWPRVGGISNIVAPEIEKATGFETRVTILGHVQRGGTPTAFDRILATRFGVAAIDLATAGGFGRMVSLRGADISDVPLKDAVGKRKVVPEELYRVAEVFFG